MKPIIAMGICLIPTCGLAGGGPAIVQDPVEVHRFFDRKNSAIHKISMIMMEAKDHPPNLRTSLRDRGNT